MHYTKFIKATGDCIINVPKLFKLIQEWKNGSNHENGKVHNLEWLLRGRKEEFITFEQFRHYFTGNHLYGFIDNSFIYAFHLIYESMCINGKPCCESKHKPSVFPGVCDFYNGLNAETLAVNSWESIYTTIIKRGAIDVKDTFKTYQEFWKFFHPFIKPFKMVSAYQDVSIIVEENDFKENGNSNRKEVPCRWYFVEEMAYYYIEFLPNGEGIIVGETPSTFLILKKDKNRYLKRTNFRVDEGKYRATIYKWLKHMNDDDFTWKLTYLNGYEHLLCQVD